MHYNNHSMRGIILIQLILLCFASFSLGQSNRTISDVYVNLPATCSDCRKVFYEVEAYNGCYMWSSMNSKIVDLEPLPGDTECSSKARITAKVTRDFKTVVIIKATDTVTKETLISQVKVSKIAEIKILTNFKAIDVEDVQKLYIQAFDEDNNVISSVEGLRFEWKIETNPHALKVISSKEANYENTLARLTMEKHRFQTDLILVKGMQTGVVELSARILEKEYEKVAKAKISLFVIEPFFLIPDKPIYILVHSEFTYKIAKGKRLIKGRAGIPSQFTEVKLPSKQYRFISGDGKLLSVNDNGTVYSKDKIGEVVVRVEDTSLINNTVEGLIYVVEPEVIELSVKDITGQIQAGVPISRIMEQLGDVCESNSEIGPGFNNWNFIVNHVYLVTSCLLDSSKNIVTLTPNLNFEVSYHKDYLVQKGSNPLASAVIFQATKPVDGIKIKSTLNFKGLAKYRVAQEKEVRILPQVKINHPTPTVLLPYLARANRKVGQPEPQMWTLNAVGGSGAYKWDSLNSAIASTTVQGIVHGLNLGTTRAIAFDVLNNLNNDSIEVEVATVGRLVWLEEKLELPLETREVLNSIALDVRGRKFTNCTSVPLYWSLKDENIIALKEQVDQSYEDIKRYVNGEGKNITKERYKYDILAEGEIDSVRGKEFDEVVQLHNMFGICGQNRVQTLREGIARVTATFQITENDGTVYKKDSEFAQVLAYKPLRTVSPSYDVFLKNLKVDEKDESYRRYIQQLKSDNEFVLGYGSGFFWEIAGGTHVWADLPGLYYDEINVNRGTEIKNTELLVSLVGEETVRSSKSQHYLECPVPSERASDLEKGIEYQVTLKAGNKQSRSLLRPAVNMLRIVVSCQIAHSMQLTWAQKQVEKEPIHYEKFPNKKSEEDSEPTYYVSSGQKFHIRMLAFDKQRKLFYNFSSYNRYEDSSVRELGIISDLIPYYMHELETTQKTGSFLVRGRLIGVHMNGRKIYDLNEVKHNIKINSVNMLKVDPEYKLLYLDERNKMTLRILQGSGNFAVRTNDSSIIGISYDIKTSARNVIVTPLRQGYVSVIVEDLGVSSSSIATAVILVSDLDRIHLRKDMILEQAMTSEIDLTYFAINGEEFSMDQYKFISVQIYQERKQIANGIHSHDEVKRGLEISKINETIYDTYRVFARDLGSYDVTAVAPRKKATNAISPDVFSNQIYIEVFPSLQIWPKKLLLLPDGSYTVKLTGGPAIFWGDTGKTSSHFGGSIARQFRSNDSNIASVDPNNGEVTGHVIGLTTVYVVITQEIRDDDGQIQYQELCKRAVPVSVQLATNVEIMGIEKRPLISGSVVRLLAVLKHYNESFTFGVFPVDYWWTSKHYHVFSLHQNTATPRLADNRDSATIAASIKSDQLGINGRSHRAGEAEVWVATYITYPAPYKHERHEFNVSVVVHVVNPLFGNVPTFIDSPPDRTCTYLLPPSCTHKLPANKDNIMVIFQCLYMVETELSPYVQFFTQEA